MSDAKIQVGVTGADQVKKAFDDMISSAQKVGGAVEKASAQTSGLGQSASKAGNFWKDAGRDIAGSIATIGTTALATVTALKTISLEQAISGVKSLDSATARYAVSGQTNVGALRSQLRGLSQATGQSEKDIFSFAKSLGRVTYSGKDALDSVRALNAEAMASGQALTDQGGLASVLSNSMGVSGGATQGFLDSFRGMSDAAGNAGGFNAAKDQLEALGGAMSELSFKTEQSKKDFLAFQLTIGKGQSPEQAKRIQGGLLAGLEAHGEGLARQFGRDNVYDENGRFKADNIPLLVDKVRKEFHSAHGKNARRALAQVFGPEVGASIDNFDLGAYANIANAGPQTSGAAGAYMLTPEGRRESNDLRANQSMEDTARSMLPFSDALGSLNADHPILTSLGLGAGAIGLKGAARAAFGSLFSGGSAAGTTSTAAGAGGIGVAGGLGLFAGGVLGSLGALTATTAPLNQNMGQIRDETTDQLELHREGLARAVVQGVERGGSGGIEGVESALGPATLGAVKNDPALASLLQQFESQSDTIAGLPDNIAKAVADALKGSPLNVNVLNSTGGPIAAVGDVQKKNSRQ